MIDLTVSTLAGGRLVYLVAFGFFFLFSGVITD